MTESRNRRVHFLKWIVFFVLCFQALALKVSYCQTLTGSNTDRPVITNALSAYVQAMGEQAGLYNGPEYTGYPSPIIDGHPYFESDQASPGNVFYDGILYKDVLMWYDIAKKEVIILHPVNLGQIVLHNEKISYFTVHDHLFIHLDADSLVSAIPGGFYDRIYHGASEVLVNRTKNFLQDPAQNPMWIEMLDQKSQYYIKKGEHYYPVKTEGSVLKALGNKQKEIQLYLKNNKIKYGKDPEKAIVLMVNYFDQLNTKP